MRIALLGIAGAALLVLTGITSSIAGDVNCGIIMKSVKMGRSVQDIAETMMISTADVEKCKKEDAEKAKEGGAAAGEKPAAEKKPAE